MMNPMAKLPVNFTAIPVNSQREVKHKRIAQKKEKKKKEEEEEEDTPQAEVSLGVKNTRHYLITLKNFV